MKGVLMMQFDTIAHLIYKPSADFAALVDPYAALLTELHQRPVTSSMGDLVRLADFFNTETLLFGFVDEVMVATAQASLTLPENQPKVIISGVVIAPACRGQGYGRALMTELEHRAQGKWGHYGRVRVELSNSPKKTNAPFYAALGYRARIIENDDPTVVWRKDLS